MKKIFVLTLLVFAILSSFAQKDGDNEIPEKVLNGLQQTYPDLKVKKWVVEDGHYIAQVKIDGSNGFVHLSKDGEWLSTRFPVDERELPTKVINYLDTKFEDINLPVVELVETATQESYYYLEIQPVGVSQDKSADLSFDLSGDLIKRNDYKTTSEPAGQQVAKTSGAVAVAAKPGETKKPAVKTVPEEEVPVTTDVKVPDAVKASFTKKYMQAQETEWSKEGELYVATYYYREVHSKAYFKADGTWQYTKEEMSTDAIYAPIQKYIDTEYSYHKVDYAEKVTRADKENTFYVEVSEKPRGSKETLVTKLYFDKVGRVVKAIEPEIPDDDMVIDDGSDEKFDQKLEKDYGNEESKKKTKSYLKESELPSAITTYIYSRYENYRIKESVIDQDEQYGEIYRVIISKEGLSQSNYDLLFKMDGKLISDNVPAEAKQEAKAPEKEDEAEESTGFPVAEAVDVPDAVSKNFTKRMPKAEEVAWTEEDKRYTASYYYRELKGASIFDASGNLLQTNAELDLERIPRPMLLYAEENYPDHKITFAEKMTRTDRNLFYHLVVTAKKKKATPKEADLYFDKVFKIMQEEPSF